MTLFGKAVIASLLLVSGVAASLVMLGLMGREGEGRRPGAARALHKALGVFFFLLLLVLVSIGVRYVAAARGELSARLVFHVVFAAAVFGLLVLKILVTRLFRGYLRIVPTLGLALFVLTILLYSVSAVFFFIRSASSGVAGREVLSGVAEREVPSGVAGREVPAGGTTVEMVAAEADSASVAAGGILYEQNCAFCHYPDRRDGKLGPGLEGLLKAERLPSSGRPATIENVLLQLREPIGTMPAFTDFTDGEIADLSAYLTSL